MRLSKTAVWVKISESSVNVVVGERIGEMRLFRTAVGVKMRETSASIVVGERIGEMRLFRTAVGRKTINLNTINQEIKTRQTFGKLWNQI